MEFNGAAFASRLVNWVQKSIKMYQSKQNLLMVVGDDFSFMNGYNSFTQIDKMIELGNKYQKRNITFKYSTPSIYMDAIKAENVKWPVFYDDIEPYNGDRFEYWSGYFTSRPNFKR